MICSTLWTNYCSKKGTDLASNKVSEFYIKEIANQNLQIINEDFERHFTYLEKTVEFLTPQNLTSIDSLRRYLDRTQKSYDLDDLAFVDQKNIVHNFNSSVDGLKKYPFLKNEIKDRIFETITLENGENQVILGIPVDKVYVNGTKLKACLIEVNIDRMVHAMTQKTENIETYCNFYYEDGKSLTNSAFAGLSAHHNILEVLDHKRITSDFKNGKSGFARLDYKNGTASLYYIPVTNTRWFLAILVFDSVINSQINSIAKDMLFQNQMQLIITLCAMLFFFVTLMLLVRRNAKLRLQSERQLTIETEKVLDEQFLIVDALSRDFKNVYRVEPEKRIAVVIKSEGYTTDAFDEESPETYPYSFLAAQYIKERVYIDDINYMAEALDLDNVLAKLKEKSEFVGSYRIIENGGIHFYQFTFRTLENEKIIVGFKNIDAAVQDAKEREALKEMSETDLMTGILNRVSGEKKISDSLKLGRGGLFCLLDIDNFKMFNDSFGHEVGDKVIIEVAHSLKKAFRDEDIVFRLGGDEFSAYAPHVENESQARKILDRFFNNIRSIDIPELNGTQITVSVGATIMEEGEETVFSEKYKLVDIGVYESKKIPGMGLTFK
ncbi:MAG: GGDEF domain-containing protein [Treponemataceae bacterium]|nr:GGDEF domain-containing protein [Treponemataceae bacterium]